MTARNCVTHHACDCIQSEVERLRERCERERKARKAAEAEVERLHAIRDKYGEPVVLHAEVERLRAALGAALRHARPVQGGDAS